jgi:hypothetical protein
VSDNGGATWRLIADDVTTAGSRTSSYDWVVDLQPTSRGRIRIRALDGTGAVGRSALFDVVPQ